jgi:uncharacterized protein YbaA (DUF1428 family)
MGTTGGHGVPPLQSVNHPAFNSRIIEDHYGGLMRYVDGFVLPVPKKNLTLYRGISQKAGKIWREHGALQYVEAVGDDLDIKFGVSFTKTIKTKPGETVVFSWIVFKSRVHRDSVNTKVMKDPRMAKMMEKAKMPFDVKRMVYGGFKFLVDA